MALIFQQKVQSLKLE